MAGVRITQLDPHGVSGRRYGSFVGKPAGGAGHPVGKITQLMPYAVPGQRYGTFAGKPTGGGVPGGDEERVRPPASFHALRHVTVLPPKFWRETA